MTEAPKSGSAASSKTCNRDCACGHSAEKYCRVTNYINMGVQFVEGNAGITCPSRVSFGTKSVCTCPARSRAFLKDGK